MECDIYCNILYYTVMECAEQQLEKSTKMLADAKQEISGVSRCVLFRFEYCRFWF